MTHKNTFNLSFLSLVVSVMSLFPLAVNSATPATWYSEIDLSTEATSLNPATSGASAISNLAVVNKTGATFRSDFNTWSMQDTNNTGITFSFSLTQASEVQLRMKTAAAIVDNVPNCPIKIMVNSSPLFLDRNPDNSDLNNTYTDTNDHWHEVEWSISADQLNVGSTNTVDIYLADPATTQYFIQSITLNPELNSYYEVDLSTATATTTVGYGSSPITEFSFTPAQSAGYTYDSGSQAVVLTPEPLPGKLTFDLTLDKLTMVQFAMKVTSSYTKNCSIRVSANGNSVLTESCANLDGFANILFQIPQADLVAGSNSIVVTAAITEATAGSGPLLIKNAAAIPQKIYSKNGVLNTTIYGQFGETTTISGAKVADIWTRGYGLKRDIMMIPAPTFHYLPGELLNVNLVNLLNTDNLKDFEAQNALDLSKNPDEILDNVNDKVKHEVNIPHNLNNTNLHVHGLHVDPAKDDVTIVIVPEGESAAGYDAPHAQHPTTSGLDEGSVADQSVKNGSWDYQYRIPHTHLPGTHWYHPHKHGSTAAQLENGMAGSMVIQESCDTGIKPIVPCSDTPNSVEGESSTQANYDRGDWEAKHDRVLMLQEIGNYGLQHGEGSSKTTDRGAKARSDVTVNGEHQPTYTLAPGQLERCRFINAGANHQAFSHLWLGRKTSYTDGTDSAGNPIPIYVSATMWQVAADGITLNAMEKITPKSPLLLAPGNRADVLISIDKADKGTYTLFKYYPGNISISSAKASDTEDKIKDNLIWDCSAGTGTCSGTLSPIAAAPASNPYLFDAYGIGNSNGTSENFAGFKQHWINVDKTSPITPIVPLIKAALQTADSNFMDITFGLAQSGDKKFSLGKAWQPQLIGFGGGGITPTKLLTLNVSGTAVTDGPKMPSPSYLQKISPLGNNFTGTIPKYVTPFTDNSSQILQSRPVLFDLSGAEIKVTGDGVKSKGFVRVKQFTLNGRPFTLNDPIGNNTTAVNGRLKQGVVATSATPGSEGSGTIPVNQVNVGEGSDESEFVLNIHETLDLVDAGGSHSAWTNGGNTITESGGTVSTTDAYYWTNPGYYQSITGDSTNGYKYSNSSNDFPTWEDVSGLKHKKPAVLNTGHGDIGGLSVSSISGLPGKPMATTGEEWILINNSDIGHPFHIHINPFFVTEVGQLSYETFPNLPPGQGEWVIRAVSVDDYPGKQSTDDAPTGVKKYNGHSAVAPFVGKWWDTVIIPPHGYVKVKYWMNVPNQEHFGNDAKVHDDHNKVGVWVYHCHILRHEDRGMMMPVITQLAPTSN